MKHKKTWMLSILMLLICLLSTTAFAIDESEVESAIAASSQEEVAGNVFIWFLCAVAFLKVSQKIDSFMSAIGINVGQTGGSMLGELMVAGKALGAAMKATGSAVGGIFNRSHNSNNNYTQAAGQAFPGSGGSLIGVAKRAAGNAAANSATGRAAGVSAFVGGAMFGSSMKSGGRLAGDVVSAVATGNIASVGSITGAKAAQALTSYLGYQSMNDESENSVTAIPQSASAIGEDVITLDGGVAAGAIPGASASIAGGTEMEADGSAAGYAPLPEASTVGGEQPIPAQAPTFRKVEIGGGRITGYETPAGGGDERQFAMYNAKQYMEPTGPFETVQTADGENWYKQYAQPVVQKTPRTEGESGKIKYDEKIVQQMPQIPKRKDKV